MWQTNGETKASGAQSDPADTVCAWKNVTGWTVASVPHYGGYPGGTKRRVARVCAHTMQAHVAAAMLVMVSTS